jgi:hypothetical protein
MGDFNFQNSNWDTNESDATSAHFLNLLMDNYLMKKPGRENNILDVVNSSELSLVDKVEVLECLGNSDHYIIVWELICIVSIGKSKLQIKKFHEGNYEGMKIWFGNIDRKKEFEKLDLNGKSFLQ